MPLNILFDPDWIAETANQMPTGICFQCQKSLLESDIKDGFCAPCWTGITNLIGELGDE